MSEDHVGDIPVIGPVTVVHRTHAIEKPFEGFPVSLSSSWETVIGFVQKVPFRTADGQEDQHDAIWKAHSTKTSTFSPFKSQNDAAWFLLHRWNYKQALKDGDEGKGGGDYTLGGGSADTKKTVDTLVSSPSVSLIKKAG